MTKYASFDPNAPYPVTGWFDTDVINYLNLPTGLLELTQTQWDNRMTSAWFVADGNLVPGSHIVITEGA